MKRKPSRSAMGFIIIRAATGCWLICLRNILRTNLRRTLRQMAQGSEHSNPEVKPRRTIDFYIAHLRSRNETMNRYFSLLYLLLLAIGAICLPLNSEGLADSKSAAAQLPRSKSSNLAARGANADYVLGPGDQITLVVPGLDDQYNEKVFRIDTSGDVTLPLVGRIRASGLSTAALEADLQIRLRTVLKDPQV